LLFAAGEKKPLATGRQVGAPLASRRWSTAGGKEVCEAEQGWILTAAADPILFFGGGVTQAVHQGLIVTLIITF
jgi:hypothetical protein